MNCRRLVNLGYGNNMNANIESPKEELYRFKGGLEVSGNMRYYCDII